MLIAGHIQNNSI